MKHELAILALWVLAAVPTLLLLQTTGLNTYLAPLFFICMLGSVYVVRSAKKKQ